MSSVFRPEYGKRIKVRPRCWWSARQRRLAKATAAILDYQYEQVVRDAALMAARGFTGVFRYMPPPWR